jgi:RimJ/RimL family protein N-acetyltransferase
MPSREPAGVVEVELRDGSWAWIRPILPEDAPALARGFERLSADSRYKRFLTPIERLTQSQLEYLTNVDHRDHEAMIAFDPAHPGVVVGVGRYVRDDSTDRAEAAVTIADDWQGKGLGTALTRLLAARAEEEGITCWTALLLAENEDMAGLLADVGDVQITDREGGTIQVDVPLDPQLARDPALRRVLRAVASSSVDLAAVPGESVEGEAPPDTEEHRTV